MRFGTTVSIVVASVLLGLSPTVAQMPGMKMPAEAPPPSVPQQPGASASPAPGGG